MEAVIMIDMQNGFLNPESSLCIRGARDTVPACARVLAAARASGRMVVIVNRRYRGDGSDVERTRRAVWEQGGRPTTPNCIRTTCYDGICLDYDVAVIEDACSSNTTEIQRANIEDMARVGAEIVDSETVIRGWTPDS